MIVVDKNGKHIGIYDRNWIISKYGKQINENIFQLDISHISFKKHNYIVRVSFCESEYRIDIKEGKFNDVIFVKTKKEVKEIIKALDAKYVFIDKNNRNSEYKKDKEIKKVQGNKGYKEDVVEEKEIIEVVGIDSEETIDDEKNNDDDLKVEKISDINVDIEKDEVKQDELKKNENDGDGKDLVTEGINDKEVLEDNKEIIKEDYTQSTKEDKPKENIIHPFIEKYRYKFYLDADHYVSFDNEKGQTHPHTWEITIEIRNKEKGKIFKFSALDEIIKNLLAPYQMKCLNDIPPFNTICPYTENIATYFKEQIQMQISNEGWEIIELAISESANRSFLI